MSPDLDQLVSEVTELTGVPKPGWLEEGAPVLGDASQPANGDRFYLVGIIGGKDVGKSALVNAIVGHPITAQTSHGPGTETVIAYAHANQIDALRELLERDVPGRFTLVPHNIPRLFRQVLLDLPDIDSHWGNHLAVTRKMLRHMLFPIWMQSVEKYADRQPQELLARVAAGNAPGNFVFCLNKVDQLLLKTDADGAADAPRSSDLKSQIPDLKSAEPGASAAPSASGLKGDLISELREDYANRLQRVLALDAPPKVWSISAIYPERYDLPLLRELLAQQKSEESVSESKNKAALRQKMSVLNWLGEQDLPGRAARLARLQAEAEDFITERLGAPLLEGVIPRLTDDPLYRQAVIDDCMAKRVARWPIVNIFHTLFSSIGMFLHRNSEARARPAGTENGEALVDQQLLALSAPTGVDTAGAAVGRSLPAIVQTTFALLQQQFPAVSALYRHRKLWEPMPAAHAAGELRDVLIGTVTRQRNVACARVDRNSGGFYGVLRVLLTIGALVWFPFIQPVAHKLLATGGTTQPLGQSSMTTILVDMLGAAYLLNMLTFFAIYFSMLWLILRWDTQRRVSRQFSRWKRLENLDPSLSLAGRTLDWIANLLEPIRTARESLDSLARRVDELRKSITTSK